MSSFIQTSPNEIKILGVSWNKLTNNLSISMPKFRQTVTKKKFLRSAASIYDPLRIISPRHAKTRETIF